MLKDIPRGLPWIPSKAQESSIASALCTGGVAGAGGLSEQKNTLDMIGLFP